MMIAIPIGAHRGTGSTIAIPAVPMQRAEIRGPGCVDRRPCREATSGVLSDSCVARYAAARADAENLDRHLGQARLSQSTAPRKTEDRTSGDRFPKRWHRAA